jgi:type I pantothenate kinase
VTATKKPVFAPYRSFTKAEWSALRADEPMTLSAEDIKRLRSLNDPISLDEAEDVYLPLSRLISFYVEAAQAVHRVSTRFLNTEEEKVPFVIGVAGSVAVGKSTTSRILEALLQRWPTSPRVALVTTDGFLFSNAELEKRGIMDRKGFPESYDRARFVKFLSDIKSGKPKVGVPVYSHLHYDLMPGEETMVEKPDILIVEGLNILQPGELPKSGKPIVFASDFIDFSIYIDADDDDLRAWFMERFQRLRQTAFTDPRSFFFKFSQMSDKEATDFGGWAWDAINLPNLRDNILPTRSRADLILRKGRSHAIDRVELRKL